MAGEKGQETKTVKIAGTRLVPGEDGDLKVDKGQGFVITPVAGKPTPSVEKPKSKSLPDTSLVSVVTEKQTDGQRRANLRAERSKARSRKATGS